MIKATFTSGQAKNAVIIGQDPAAYIAVIRASGVRDHAGPPRHSFRAARRGHLLAIASPLGLSGTVTSGIVSALHRSITAGSQNSPYNSLPGQSQQGSTELKDAIQTNTAINPGNC